jgi:Protein of unknown function (DUF1579)
MRTASLALLLIACTGPDMVAAPAAPPTPATGCSGPEYRLLEFWLGEWEVRDARGRLMGENRIEAILGGCAVREMWTDARGGRGESLFFRDQRGWKQVWVTSDGTWKEKSQVAAPAGAVRFQGKVARGDGTALDRTTLSRLADGRVRQRIESSTDGGATWKPWEGIYTRRKPRCASAAHRELDFWLGEWDVVLRVRKSPRVDEWAVSRGVNRIESILDGCAVEERFSAVGPDQPWAGRSLSRWVEGERKWRQAWVDDTGSYLAFSGGMQGKDMVLVGEPFVRDGERLQMRMVFTEIQADSLLWRWERTADAGATWLPMMIIEYRRAR